LITQKDLVSRIVGVPFAVGKGVIKSWLEQVLWTIKSWLEQVLWIIKSWLKQVFGSSAVFDRLPGTLKFLGGDQRLQMVQTLDKISLAEQN